MRILTLYCLFLITGACTAQPTFTANDAVPPFTGHFGYGANMGYYPPDYYDEQLAILAHGSPDGAVPGVGVTTIRPALFEHFLDYWGYDIRLNTFKLYDSIGLKDLVVFTGYPADRHRDSTLYCADAMSEVFKNLYEPIWDGGLNGTPVNDNNPYALYIWKMATTYNPYVKYWEIWNEPDLDFGGHGWKTPDMENNWWTNAPQPCEIALRAPVFYYNRILRISYEVIKSVDPTDYVCVGGLGHPSFLDVICRYTDNPNGGAISSKYPLKGGAYFDVMSYHAYPHIDNSLREWSNDIFNFVYFRHSDRAVDGVWKQKKQFDDVLAKYHYDGQTYPEKRWIITEINTPRKQYDEFLGSDDSQTNFMMKALITAQMNGVDQMHVYSLSDDLPESEAKNEFSYMGMFKNLKNVKPYNSVPNRMAWGYKTTSELLHNKWFDAGKTAEMHLPSGVRGGAFTDDSGEYTYVLWAETSLDRSEVAEAYYAFPKEMHVSYVDVKYWNHSLTKAHHLGNSGKIRLTGSPIFLTNRVVSESSYPKSVKILPNPTESGTVVVSFWMFEAQKATMEIFNAKGQLVQLCFEDQDFVPGAQQILVDLSGFAAGTYFARLRTIANSEIVPFVKI